MGQLSLQLRHQRYWQKTEGIFYDWEDSFYLRPTLLVEQEAFQSTGRYSLEGLVFSLCVNLERAYRNSVHPQNCMRERMYRDILGYMDTMTREDQIRQDLETIEAAGRIRGRIGFWPVPVQDVQRWIYCVAENFHNPFRPRLLQILFGEYEEDIIAVMRGLDCINEVSTYDVIRHSLRGYFETTLTDLIHLNYIYNFASSPFSSLSLLSILSLSSPASLSPSSL